MNSAPSPAPTDPVVPRSERLPSLDVFRGAIMLLMASSGLGIPQVAKYFPDSPVWPFLGRQCEHTEWTGCTLWDLIQPSFMFMVGVALPWSLANRRARGQPASGLFAHAIWRSLMLILLAVFLTSAWSRQTEWVFTNVLAQIGLGYPFLFLIALTKPRTQWIAAAVVLIGTWLLYALHPLPTAGFDWKAVGVPADWPHLQGLSAHWDKNANLGATFDRTLLNLFPRETPFTHNQGGYSTLNFLPSLATMIFGLLAGELLRSDVPMTRKLSHLVIAGVAGILLGTGIEIAGLCPIVKRIWTPSWALFSGGWVALLLAGFVAVVDWQGWKRWTFPLVVAGLNPITLYCLWQLSGGFVRDSLKTHLGQGLFESLGAPYAPVLERGAVLLCFWLVLLWMHSRKLFLRL